MAQNDNPLADLHRHFNQEVEITWSGMAHAALTGLVAGALQGLKAKQPIINAVGHADPAGIPVRFNGGERYLVIVVPVDG